MSINKVYIIDKKLTEKHYLFNFIQNDGVVHAVFAFSKIS